MIPARAPLSVIVPPAIVPRLASGRVRAIPLPIERAAALTPDGFMWVAEPVTIEAGQPRDDALLVRYSAQVRPSFLAWPKGAPKPPAGRRDARSMPLECSRYTLAVLGVSARRFRAITDDDAIACGADPVLGGWVPLTAQTDNFRPFVRATDALAYLWADLGIADCPAANPEIALVRFVARARNIARIVPGVGFGGAADAAPA